MGEVYGTDFEIVLAKELTKIHQNVKKLSINIWLENFKKQPPKGEFTLLFTIRSN
jgi:16S rRNA C1402 (ribose-2'-O) methylase RsmI